MTELKSNTYQFPMWSESFRELQQNEASSLTSLLLTGKIRFEASEEAVRQDLISRASAILGILPKPPAGVRKLVIQRSTASAAEARLLLLAQVFTAHATKFGRAGFQAKINGPLLFITQQITRCRALLESIKISTIKITDVYPALSMPRLGQGLNNQAIYLANPGRLQAIAQHSHFGAVVIDATHPRTLAHLESLSKCSSISSTPVQVILKPLVEILANSRDETLYWLWEPTSVQEIGRSLERTPTSSDLTLSKREYWIAEEEKIEELLAELHGLLAKATQISTGRPPAQLLLIWQLYHRFRQLCVPLEYLERAWRRSRYRTIKEQIEALSPTQWTGASKIDSFLAVNGVRIVELLTTIYKAFSEIGEPGKFFSAASTLEILINDASDNIRIVVPTQVEAFLLADFMTVIVDGLSESMAEGRVEFVHQAEEARRVSEGRVATALLLGARPSRFRYLDIFPQRQVHLVTYDFEASADQSAIRYFLNGMRPYAANSYRCQVLAKLGLHVSEESNIEHLDLPNPPVEIHPYLDHYRKTNIESIEAAPFVLDLSSLPQGVTFGNGIRSAVDPSVAINQDTVSIVDTEGVMFTFLEEEKVDVYYAETNQIRRKNASDLRIGDLLILLLDNHYEALFARLLEAIDNVRPEKETILLERWRAAKQKILENFDGNRTEIYSKVESELTVEYGALITWFREEDECEDETIGPLRYEDFAVMAKLSHVFIDDSDLERTFLAITNERTNRRKMGRALRKALKVLVSGASYDSALEAAEALNTPVDDVLNAVEIREVSHIEHIKFEGAHDE